MTDWKSNLWQFACYKNIKNDLDDVASCLSILPEELDTPGLSYVREQISKYGAKPLYQPYRLEKVGDPIHLKDIVNGRKPIDISRNGDILEDNLLKETPENVLYEIKNRIMYGLLEATTYSVYNCNQRIEREYDEDKMQHVATGKIIDGNGHQICKVDAKAIMDIRKGYEKLKNERWNKSEMVRDIRKQAKKTWIKENAWDLTREELRTIDIEKRLGFEKNDK